MAAPESDDIQQIHKEIDDPLSDAYEHLIYTINECERQDHKLKDLDRVVRHNDGDTSSETYSNDKRANGSHLSESTETTTARRYTEGEASSEQDSRQDIQENKIEGSTPSVIPVMENRSYTPCPLSTRGSVIMAYVTGSRKRSFHAKSAAWISSATTTCIPIPRQRIARKPPLRRPRPFTRNRFSLCLVKCHS